MTLIQIFQSEYLSILFGGFGGILAALFTQKILNKRGLFTYFVTHTRVGFSSEDTTFGNVSLTWNGNAVRNLYLSTLRLKNESLNDYEKVVIQVYTSNTIFLRESTQVLDTPTILEWSDKFKTLLKVPEGQQPTENQQKIFNGQREFVIPVFNRGQEILINILNSPTTANEPSIFLSATIKGVRVKYRIPQNQTFGVPQPLAALAGVLIGVIGLFPLVNFVSNVWAIAISAITYGFIARVPGAFAVKVYRRLRDTIGG